jgi:glucosamine--fructose-6-phosphate aminotransferase (isomerizing)
MADLAGYPHYMLKEIFENPRAVRDTVADRVLAAEGRIRLEDIHISDAELRQLSHIKILASGTSRHAGIAGKIMIQELAGIRVEVDYASEFEYCSPMIGPHELTIFITQSGETADTIGALSVAAGKGAKTLAICNVVGSMIAQRADAVIYTHAGPEVAIASTKAFTAQLAALFLFAVYLGEKRGVLPREAAQRHVRELLELPGKLERALGGNSVCEQLAEKYVMASDFLFLGRGVHFPAALDGALKLKEVSYIHAEGYPAGEIKHGPYALIDATMPIVFLAARDTSDAGSMQRYNMTLQNMRDVKARLGRIIAVAVEGSDEVRAITKDVVFIPEAPELLLPLVEIVPLQLLAYHMALQRGLNVDKPRNLVKAVTKE